MHSDLAYIMVYETFLLASLYGDHQQVMPAVSRVADPYSGGTCFSDRPIGQGMKWQKTLHPVYQLCLIVACSLTFGFNFPTHLYYREMTLQYVILSWIQHDVKISMNSNVYIKPLRTERMKVCVLKGERRVPWANKWCRRQAKDGRQVNTNNKIDISMNKSRIDYCDGGPFGSAQVKLVYIIYFDPAYIMVYETFLLASLYGDHQQVMPCCVQGGWPL